MAGGGGTDFTVEVRDLAVDRLDRDLEVGARQHRLQVVAGRLEEATVPEQVAAKRREAVLQRGVRPLHVKADVQLTGSGVEHRLTKWQP